MTDFVNPPYSSYQSSYSSQQTFVNGNPITALITPTLILDNYLAGIPLTATANGQDLTVIVQQKIDAAVGEFETKLDAFVVPRVILSCVVGQTPQIITNLSTADNPAGMVSGRPAVAGVDYDMLEVPYDYTTRRFERWSTIKVKRKPVLDVSSILFALPPNFGILQVPQPWITTRPNAGIIQIVPVEGAMAVTSPGAGMWLPFFTMGQMNHVPQFTQISYTAGIYPLSEDMIDAISQLAAAKVLEVFNRAFYPGVQSFTHSVDGFNQSVNLRAGGPFMDDIKTLKQNAYDYIKAWKAAHAGIIMAQLGR